MFSIQAFHDAGLWQTLGAYQGFADAASALTVAVRLADGRNGRMAFPLGLRVIGDDYKSPIVGGRRNIRILNDPLTDQWVAGCTNCPAVINGDTPYAATEFARRHVCGEENEPVHAGRLIRIVSSKTRRG